MRYSFEAFVVTCLLFLSSCSNISQAQDTNLGLADHSKLVILNDVVSEFAEHFPYHGQSLWVSSADNTAQNNDVLKGLLAKKGYSICKQGEGGVGYDAFSYSNGIDASDDYTLYVTVGHEVLGF
ncbi:hypothetical protein N9449_07120 [Oceanospirillaceae bacterium]|nr:hypothetical protein [Oceanospirillaceae bacterium]